MPPSPDIVIALIWRAGALLVGLRPEGKSCPLLWEFPGGKCEPGETHAEALTRECAEELGVTVTVGPRAASHTHGTGDEALNLAFYHCSLKDASAVPQPRCTLALRWVEPAQLGALPFCPGDLDVIAALMTNAVRPPHGMRPPVATSPRAAS